MEEFFKEVLTSKWWLSVVIVGLLINIISSFVFKWYENYSANYSSEKRKKLEELERYKQEKISNLIGNKEEQIFQYLRISQHKQSAIENFLIGVLILNIPLAITSPLGFIITFIPNIMAAIFAFTYIRLGLEQRKLSRLENAIIESALQKELEIPTTAEGE